MVALSEELVQYVERWTTYDHQNVAKCYGYALGHGPMPALIMKYHVKGNIIRYLKENHGSFDDKTRLVQGIAEGLYYLHTLEPPVIHGDLRGANILVDDERNAVIADYQLVYVGNSGNVISYEPARWMAPELSESSDYTKATDTFAFAMTIIEVFTECVPFGSEQRNTTILRIIWEGGRPNIPEDILNHSWFSILLRQCWEQNPTMRLTTGRVREQFIKNFRRPRRSRTNIFSYISNIAFKIRLLGFRGVLDVLLSLAVSARCYSSSSG